MDNINLYLTTQKTQHRVIRVRISKDGLYIVILEVCTEISDIFVGPTSM